MLALVVAQLSSSISRVFTLFGQTHGYTQFGACRAGPVGAIGLGRQNAGGHQTAWGRSVRGQRGVAGFSAPDTHGRWSGLDVDVCRAVAAAVLGDPEK